MSHMSTCHCYSDIYDRYLDERENSTPRESWSPAIFLPRVGSVMDAMDMSPGTPAPPRAHMHMRSDGHLDPGDGSLRDGGVGTLGDRGGLGHHPRGWDCGLPRYTIRPHAEE